MRKRDLKLPEWLLQAGTLFVSCLCHTVLSKHCSISEPLPSACRWDRGFHNGQLSGHFCQPHGDTPCATPVTLPLAQDWSAHAQRLKDGNIPPSFGGEVFFARVQSSQFTFKLVRLSKLRLLTLVRTTGVSPYSAA